MGLRSLLRNFSWLTRFFSYSRANQHPLIDLFKDLCDVVGQGAAGLVPGFRDVNSIPPGQPWDPAIVNALQSSAVMLCLVTPNYLQSEACGRELHLYRQHLGGHAVVIPVMWTKAAIPPALAAFQFPVLNMPVLYHQEGLFFVRFRRKIGQYINCVAEFARAIISTLAGIAPVPVPLPTYAGLRSPAKCLCRTSKQDRAERHHVCLRGRSRKESPQGLPQYGETWADWRPSSTLTLRPCRRSPVVLRRVSRCRFARCWPTPTWQPRFNDRATAGTSRLQSPTRRRWD